MSRSFRAATALLLSGALLWGSASATYYPARAHEPVDYTEMSPADFDAAPLTQALDELEAMADSGELDARTRRTHSQAAGLYEDILDGFDQFYTHYCLTMIAYDRDYTDADAASAYNAATEQLTVLQDRCYSVLAQLAQSPNADILERDGEGLADSLAYYAPMTEEEAALFRTENELVARYEQLLGSDYDPQDVGELYLELVAVRNEQATLYGYDNYADYAYESVYLRDYSPKDVQATEDAVKERFAPLLDTLASTMSESFEMLSALPATDAETRLDAVEPYISQLHPELAESFSFLRQYHLYDLDDGDTKLPMGYTVELPAYGSAFIFDSPYGDFTDYATLLHEFGHFNNSFHLTDRALWAGSNMDVSEIHSQALELLFTEYADDIFGTLGPAFRWYEVYSVLSGAVDGFLFDEFEQAVYARSDLTTEGLNDLFLSIADSYGGGYEATDWMEISHLFQSPFYYISYGTSALTALELWLLSLDQWESAVDAYMTLSALSTDATYGEAVELAGLGDIFAPETQNELAERLAEAMSEELGLPLSVLTATSGDSPAILIAGWLILAVGIFALYRKKENTTGGT